ncbi:TPA: LPXTG cell wall anchor domain-containing protein, partial [Streptococcus suis]
TESTTEITSDSTSQILDLDTTTIISSNETSTQTPSTTETTHQNGKDELPKTGEKSSGILLGLLIFSLVLSSFVLLIPNL